MRQDDVLYPGDIDGEPPEVLPENIRIPERIEQQVFPEQERDPPPAPGPFFRR